MGLKVGDIFSRIDLKTSAEDSSYYFKLNGISSNKVHTYNKAISVIEERYAGTDVDPKSTVEKAYRIFLKKEQKEDQSSGLKSNENVSLFTYRVFNKETAKLFDYFKYSIDSAGNIICYIKTHSQREEYMYSENLIQSARNIKVSVYSKMKNKYVKKNLGDMMVAYFNKLLGLNLLSGAMDYSGDSGNKPVDLDIQKYWDKFAFEVWKLDNRFKLEKMPVTLSSDPEEPTFKYIDLSGLVEYEPETYERWSYFMHMVPDCLKDAAMAGIYAVFVPENTGRQSMWWYDRGFTGKSSMFNALGRALSNPGRLGYGAVSTQGFQSPHSIAQIFDRRLWVCGDCSNPHFLSHDIVRKATGGDPVDVNPKNEKHFTATINMKLMVGSNLVPQINIYNTHETSRIIYIPLMPPEDSQLLRYCFPDKKDSTKPMRDAFGKPVFIKEDMDDVLYKQLIPFLFECKKAYDKVCMNRKTIYLNKEAIGLIKRDCVSQEQSDFEHIAEKNFMYGRFFACNKSEIHDTFMRNLPPMVDKKQAPFLWAKFFEHLKIKFGIKEDRYTVEEMNKLYPTKAWKSSERKRCIRGIIVKDNDGEGVLYA